MDKTQSVSLLKKIYENARTGKDAIGVMLNRASSDELIRLLSNQQNKYHDIATEASGLLGSFRELPPERSFFKKFEILGGINSVYSGKNERLAESIINGSTGGIIEIKGYINKNPDADNFSKNLAEKLIDLERESINIAEKYL